MKEVLNVIFMSCWICWSVEIYRLSVDGGDSSNNDSDVLLCSCKSVRRLILNMHYMIQRADLGNSAQSDKIAKTYSQISSGVFCDLDRSFGQGRYRSQHVHSDYALSLDVRGQATNQNRQKTLISADYKNDAQHGTWIRGEILLLDSSELRLIFMEWWNFVTSALDSSVRDFVCWEYFLEFPFSAFNAYVCRMCCVTNSAPRGPWELEIRHVCRILTKLLSICSNWWRWCNFRPATLQLCFIDKTEIANGCSLFKSRVTIDDAD